MPRTVVVKVGSSTLTDKSGRLDDAYLASLAGQLSEIAAEGVRVVLVSSGAISAGAERLGWELPLQSLRRKQAAAAVGQGCLIERYSQAFAARGRLVAQVLLTRGDAGDRTRYLNTRHTLDTLLRHGVVPIVNENDTVAVDEIQFGDNDRLAGLVAAMVEADLLLMLTNVEGLLDDGGKLVSRLEPQDMEMRRLAGGPRGPGSGGMVTKLEAAHIAGAAGIRTVIAHGRRAGVVAAVVAGECLGTEVQPYARRLKGRKHWIAFGPVPRGWLQVNERAHQALVQEGRSLLPAGVIGVAGPFHAGDPVSLRHQNGSEFARGVVNCNDTEAQRIQGARTDEIRGILGRDGLAEIVHRDNLVIL